MTGSHFPFLSGPKKCRTVYFRHGSALNQNFRSLSNGGNEPKRARVLDRRVSCITRPWLINGRPWLIDRRVSLVLWGVINFGGEKHMLNCWIAHGFMNPGSTLLIADFGMDVMGID